MEAENSAVSNLVLYGTAGAGAGSAIGISTGSIIMMALAALAVIALVAIGKRFFTWGEKRAVEFWQEVRVEKKKLDAKDAAASQQTNQ